MTLQEVLYDGIWLYTSAIVTPTDPATTLIMPASADIQDFVYGGYNENLRIDPRRFIEAALQDQKDLQRVSVYPVEFDQLSYYFLDHRQDAGDQSTVFSGAPLGGMEETLSAHLSVRLDLFDPLSSTFTHTDIYEFPITIQRIGSIDQRDYSTDHASFPFHSLSLIQTPLTVYAFPEGKMESSYHLHCWMTTLLPYRAARRQTGIPTLCRNYQRNCMY